MAYDQSIAERIRNAIAALELLPGEATAETKMFGGLCFTLNRKMVVGIERSRVIVRLSDADFGAASDSGEAVPMDFTGRPLKNFAYLAGNAGDTEGDLLKWISRSAAFVRSQMTGPASRIRKRK